MYKLNKILFLGVVLLVSNVTTAADNSNTVAKEEVSKDSSEIIQANNKNPDFTITVSSNPSTGYHWYIADYDRNVLYLTDHKYTAPESFGKVGVAGKEEWTFTISSEAQKASYITTINLVYMRPWDVGSMQSKKYYVAIN